VALISRYFLILKGSDLNGETKAVSGDPSVNSDVNSSWPYYIYTHNKPGFEGGAGRETGDLIYTHMHQCPHETFTNLNRHSFRMRSHNVRIILRMLKQS
jgi:hypothetical protein